MGYTKSAQYYDLFGEKPDIDYYKELGIKYGSALEIGIGTARVALELARANVDVWGIDNSEEMLEIARQKIADEPAEMRKRIVLKKAEMTNFHLSQTFPLIYVPSSGLSHCVTTEDQLTCLKCVYEHLEKNGLFVFDIVLPKQSYNSGLTLINKKDVGSKTVVRWIFNRPDFLNQLLHTTLIFEVYEHEELTEKIIESSTVSLIYKRELLLLLDTCNFEVDNMYGDFLKSDLIANLLVVKARKP